MGGVGGIKPTFAIQLSDGGPGQITFGGYDTSRDIFWAEMAHKKDYFWTVNMDENVKLGKEKLPISSKHMILDSGVSYALIPTEDFNNLH
jgi:hypothetical protein